MWIARMKIASLLINSRASKQKHSWKVEMFTMGPFQTCAVAWTQTIPKNLSQKPNGFHFQMNVCWVFVIRFRCFCMFALKPAMTQEYDNKQIYEISLIKLCVFETNTKPEAPSKYYSRIYEFVSLFFRWFRPKIFLTQSNFHRAKHLSIEFPFHFRFSSAQSFTEWQYHRI